MLDKNDHIFLSNVVYERAVIRRFINVLRSYQGSPTYPNFVTRLCTVR